MPICFQTDNDNYTLGLWELLEDEKQLMDNFIKIAPKNEILKAEKFKYQGRRSEWIATRLLIYKLLNKVVTIDYDENGKPLIQGVNQSISISHTKGMAAVIIAKNMAGIDIEMVNDRVSKIESKFMSGIEMNQISDEAKMIHLLAYWSAKETLYKISGGKGLDFKKNLYVNPFQLRQKGEFTCEVITNNQTIGYQLNYFLFDQNNQNTNYLIVFYYN